MDRRKKHSEGGKIKRNKIRKSSSGGVYLDGIIQLFSFTPLHVKCTGNKAKTNIDTLFHHLISCREVYSDGIICSPPSPSFLKMTHYVIILREMFSSCIDLSIRYQSILQNLISCTATSTIFPS